MGYFEGLNAMNDAFTPPPLAHRASQVGVNTERVSRGGIHGYIFATSRGPTPRPPRRSVSGGICNGVPAIVAVKTISPPSPMASSGAFIFCLQRRGVGLGLEVPRSSAAGVSWRGEQGSGRGTDGTAAAPPGPSHCFAGVLSLHPPGGAWLVERPPSPTAGRESPKPDGHGWWVRSPLVRPPPFPCVNACPPPPP